MRWILFLCALLWALGATAQPVLITGNVRDVNGAPVPFATVTEVGTRNAVTCDVNGHFSIRVQSISARLMISSQSFTLVTVTAANASTVTLNRTQLEEVVVTALGLRRRSQMIGFSTGRVAGINISDEGSDGKKLSTWKRSSLDENSVKLAVGDNDFLPLKSAQVAVQVDGFRARVVFDYYFLNTRGSRLRGTFRLKLPAGASPCYFAFGDAALMPRTKAGTRAALISYDPSLPFDLQKDSLRSARIKLKEARVVPKEKAAYAFNEVVRGNVDPALAQWAGADVFSCAVFPLVSGQLHHISIAYDLNLHQSGAEALLELALPLGDIKPTLDITISNTGGNLATLEPALPAKISDTYSRYHTDRFDGQSISISQTLPQTVMLQQPGSEPYFALSHTPLLEQTSRKGNEQAIFLLDVSWSSQPDKFNVWLKTIEAILRENRRTIKSFAVLCFHVDAFWWRKSFSRNTEHNLSAFLNYADKLALLGATDLNQALGEAARPAWLTAAGRETPRSIFLLSDGDASWGGSDLYQLSGKLRAQDPLYAFTTGFSGTDGRILDHLARESGGAVFSILNEDEVQEAARAIRYEPWRITSLKAKGGKDMLIAGRPYNIFPGQKLVITGRGEPAAGETVEIQVSQASKIKTIVIEPDIQLQSPLARRIYGQVAVEQLASFSWRTETATAKYASYFDVPGEQYAFLMLESPSMYQRFGLEEKTLAGYVDSTGVMAMLNRLLQTEEQQRSLGSARAELMGWLNRLRKDGPLKISLDKTFEDFAGSIPDSRFEVSLPALHAENIKKSAWQPASLRAIQQEAIVYQDLLKQVELEKNQSGVADAFALISTAAESNRDDITLLRDIAFHLEQWQLQGKAFQLLSQLVRDRPAEPATWGMLCANLQKIDRPELALIFYDIAFHTRWDARFKGFDLTLALDYFRLVQNLSKQLHGAEAQRYLAARKVELAAFLAEYNMTDPEADIVVVITWNTDNTDVDLHVREPSGEECFYGHPRTKQGGLLSNDATQGFGPELYLLRKAETGRYHIDVNYFASSNVQTSASSKILVRAYKNWGRSNETHSDQVIELTRDRNANADENDKNKRDVLTIDF
jgi:hypothetical protein